MRPPGDRANGMPRPVLAGPSIRDGLRGEAAATVESIPGADLRERWGRRERQPDPSPSGGTGRCGGAPGLGPLVDATGRYRTQASGSGARFSRCEVSIRDDKCVSLTFRPLDAAVPGEDRGERDRCSMSENTPPGLIPARASDGTIWVNDGCPIPSSGQVRRRPSRHQDGS